MARFVVAAVAGVAVGYYTGSYEAGFKTFAAVYAIGGAVEAANKKLEGPRLEDLKLTSTEYGAPIPWFMGAPRIAGGIWWSTDKYEVAHSEQQGKGGGPTLTTFTYAIDCIIGLSECEIAGVTRAWSNGKLVWSRLGDDVTTIESISTDAWARITFYLGTEDQLPDPTYEAAVGVGNAPAYRGRAYAMIEGLNLGGSGYLPNLTFEVTTQLDEETAIVRKVYVANTGVTYGRNSAPGIGRPTIFSMSPTVRVGILSDNDFTVYSYDLQGNLLEAGLRSQAEMPYPGVSGGDPISYPVGILDGFPVRVQLLGTPIGTPMLGGEPPHLVAGNRLASADGIFGYNLAAFIDPTEYIEGVSLCTDGKHYIVFTSPDGTTIATNKWWMMSFEGTVVSLVRTGTLHASAQNTNFGFGNATSAGSAEYIANSLDPDLVTLWTAYGAGTGDVVRYKIDESDVLAIDELYVGLAGDAFDDYTFIWPSCWAQYGYLVAVGTSQFLLYGVGTPAIGYPTLQETVEALCARAGMPVGSYDASGLATITKPVRACVASRVGPTRPILEQLMAGYFFGSCLSDKLYFRPRASEPVMTIPFEHLATGLEKADGAPLDLNIASDLELPPQVAVGYANILDDHQIGVEMSDRFLSGQAALSTIQLALAFTPSEAKGIADAIVLDGLASLTTSRISLPLQYAKLEATDVVEVLGEDGLLAGRFRIGRKTDGGAVQAFDVVADDPAAVVSAAITDDAYPPNVDTRGFSPTVLLALDIPLLRDVDDGPGWIAGAKGETPVWPGAVVMSAVAPITLAGPGLPIVFTGEFSQVAQIDEKAVFGICTTTLGDWAGGNVFDELNSVTVSVGEGEIASTTRDALIGLAPSEALLIGSEVIRWIDSELVSTSPNVYRVTRLLRGELGTDWAMVDHAANERAVLLRPQGLRHVSQEQWEVNLEHLVKAVTLGRSTDSGVASSFTNTGISQKPYSPVDLRSSRTMDGGMVLTWERRTRLAFVLFGGVEPPLGESLEAYDVEILDGPDVVRTIGASQPSASYSSSEQIEDFGEIQGELSVRVYQRNATERGYPLEATTGEGYEPVGQTNTITFAGTADDGVPIYVYADGDLILSTTSAGGSLSGHAAALASALDALAGYEASAVGSVVTVEGPLGVAYSLTVIVGGSAFLSFNLAQSAEAAGPGTPYTAQLLVSNNITGLTEPVPSGTSFTVNVYQPLPTLLGSLSFTTSYTSTRADVISGLASALAATAMGASGYTLSLTSGPYGYYGVFRAPVGRMNVELASSGSPFYIGISIVTLATEPVPEDRPQIIEASVFGTPDEEDYTVTLDSVDFTYAALPGDTADDVAAGLAAVVDAHAQYTATSTGPIATITSVTDAVPFSYAGTVARSFAATVA